jgi:anti-anti-sigma factor
MADVASREPARGRPLEEGHTLGLHGDDTGSLREHPVREVVTRDGAIVVRLAGDLDVFHAQVVREALADAAEPGADRLVVDLTEVDFLDSTMLGVLVEARAKLANRRGFLLAAPGPDVRRTLEVSGLDRHFEVHETVDNALAAQL